MRRGLVLAGLILLLTGCGGADERAPFAESRIPPSLGPGFWPPEGWAWGLIKVGDAPAQRYGVSGPTGTPRANILILTGYGETAEVWFETARDLNAAGYSVWVLERAGQGGSERYAGPRDLIHVPSFDGDIASVKALARTIVQGAPETPLAIVGYDVGALVALSAVQSGAPARSLVLESPDLEPDGGPAALPGWLLKIGLGRIPAGWGQGWNREGPDAFKAGLTRDLLRGGVQKAWQTANPDLRMGGRTLGWNAAFKATSKTAGENLNPLKAKVYVTGPVGGKHADEGERACKVIAGCETGYVGGPATGGAPSPRRDAPVGAALHLEAPDRREEFVLVIIRAAGGTPPADNIH